jgi:hypothetical protein
MPNQPINVSRAKTLKYLYPHLTYARIGRIMAREERREIPYQAHSIASAIAKESRNERLREVSRKV